TAGREGERQDRSAVALEWASLPVEAGLPQLDQAIVCGAGEETVRCVRQRANAGGMSQEHVRRLVLAARPNTDGAIGAAARQDCATGRESEGAHGIVVAFERGRLLPLRQVPPLDQLVRSPAGELTVAGERERQNSARMASECTLLLAGRQVPQLDG